MLALGRYPEVSLAQARKLRDEAKEQLKNGDHPTRLRKAQKLRRVQEGENTFEKVARRWFEQRDPRLNKKYNKQNLDRMEQLVFPIIGGLPLKEINIPDIVTVIEKIAARGTIETAKRIGQLISQIFRYASQRGMCVYNPAADLRAILPAGEEKHHAAVPLAELPELLQKIKNREDDFSKYAMQLLALTFVRTNELIGAKWNEIDWDRQEWHIPKERMKMKCPHLVPLSRQALEVLKRLREKTAGRDFIFFSGASKSKHISNGTVLMALRRMGYQGRMTGHGFRTLASTILNEQGYPVDAIERQLAHEDNDKIRSAYNRAEYLLERKKMMQDYADYLESLVTADANKKVVSLSPVRKTKKRSNV